MFGRKPTSSLQSKDFLSAYSQEHRTGTDLSEQDSRDIAQLEEMRGYDASHSWTSSLMQKAQKLVGRSHGKAVTCQSLEEAGAASLDLEEQEEQTEEKEWAQSPYNGSEDNFMEYATKKAPSFDHQLDEEFSHSGNHPGNHRSAHQKGFVNQMLPEDFSEDSNEEVLEELEIEKPETVIGEGVSLKGQLCFKRYLCINGEFEGDLKSSGKVKVGKTGVVRSNLKLHSAVIEGKVVGDLIIDDLLELRGSAQVYGNIRARYLRVDDGVTLNGHVQIMPGGLVKAQESTLFADKETVSSADPLVDSLDEADFSLSH